MNRLDTPETASRAALVTDTRQSPRASLRPVSLTDVTLEDAFWSPRTDQVRRTTLPLAHDRLVESGAVDNFRHAPHGPAERFRGRYYSDSDVYKWVEAACWSLASAEDAALSRRLGDVVEAIIGAQDTDGYLNTYFAGERREQRWSDLSRWHEMYCIGHLVQAAIAHHRATGHHQLLDAAARACEHVESRFTPGRTHGACGHPNLEMALIELYRTTGERRWLNLSAWQMESRGRGGLDASEYLLDHTPVREQTVVTGHAVRALYLYAGLADLLLETDDTELESVVDALWHDLSCRKTSVTGGLGARWDGEAFGDSYELPDRAYNETCAAIAKIFFAWRMLLRTGEGRYRDAIEHTLYNAVLPALSSDGTAFFYQNPLEDSGRHRRQAWFDCACCPPNLARLLVSLPGYLYAVSDQAIWVNQLIGSTVALNLDATPVRLTLRTDLPRSGSSTLTLNMPHDIRFSLRLPAPAWAGEVTVRVGGEQVTPTRERGYLVIDRVWQDGDLVVHECTTPVRLLQAHPRVAAAHHRVALTRGPLVFCLEQADNEVDIRDLRLHGTETWDCGKHPALPETLRLTTEARAVSAADDQLYTAWSSTGNGPTRPALATAIPYYAWGNREAGPMRVMIPLLSR